MTDKTVRNIRSNLDSEYVRSVLDYNPDTGVLSWKPRKTETRTGKTWNSRYAGKEAGTIQGSGHRNLCLLGEKWLAHRIAWLHYYGEWPSGIVDHINQDPADNRIANLRESSWGENVGNSQCRADNTSGVKGVYWHKTAKRWHACIGTDGAVVSLGYFDDIEDAREARCQAEQKYWGFQCSGEVTA